MVVNPESEMQKDQILFYWGVMYERHRSTEENNEKRQVRKCHSRDSKRELWEQTSQSLWLEQTWKFSSVLKVLNSPLDSRMNTVYCNNSSKYKSSANNAEFAERCSPYTVTVDIIWIQDISVKNVCSDFYFWGTARMTPRVIWQLMCLCSNFWKAKEYGALLA